MHVHADVESIGGAPEGSCCWYVSANAAALMRVKSFENSWQVANVAAVGERER